MQIKLRKEEQVGDWYKQWIETKCWFCNTSFSMFRKNMFQKHGNNRKALRHAQKLKNLKKKIIEIEEEEEEDLFPLSPLN